MFSLGSFAKLVKQGMPNWQRKPPWLPKVWTIVISNESTHWFWKVHRQGVLSKIRVWNSSCWDCVYISTPCPLELSSFYEASYSYWKAPKNIFQTFFVKKKKVCVCFAKLCRREMLRKGHLWVPGLQHCSEWNRSVSAGAVFLPWIQQHMRSW